LLLINVSGSPKTVKDIAEKEDVGVKFCSLTTKLDICI